MNGKDRGKDSMAMRLANTAGLCYSSPPASAVQEKLNEIK
jgi:hypothetical protein